MSHLASQVTSAVMAGGGMFTSTRPDVRRIIPEARPGVPVVKVVYVVLEAQYQSSLSAAVRNINRTREDLRVEVVGYLVEELRDKDNYETFCKDLEDCNVFIGSLIFVEELATKVKTAVEAQRDRMDAVLIFPSMPEVMRLNKLGTFSMAQLGQSKSAIAQFMRKKRKGIWRRI